MPKARIEYDLPEENWEYKCANNGSTFFIILSDIDNYLREKLKYGHKYKSVDETLEDIRRKFWELLNDKGLNLDE